MARSVSLFQLRTDVAEQADVAGNAARYTPTLLNRLINQSRQKFAREISNAGVTHLLEPHSGTTGVGPTSPYQFQTLDLSAASPSLVAVYGVDVTLSGGDRLTLSQVPFSERSMWGSADHSGQPHSWAAFQTRKVALFPAPDQAYAYTVWFLPALTDMSADVDTWDGVAGWEDAVRWDVVCALMARDNNTAAFQLAAAERQHAMVNIVTAANRVTRAGSATVAKDTFGRRIGLQRATHKWPPRTP